MLFKTKKKNYMRNKRKHELRDVLTKRQNAVKVRKCDGRTVWTSLHRESVSLRGC